MKRLIAGAVLAIGLATTAYGAGDPEAGEAQAAVCAGCHGQGGAKPTQAVYPKLSGLGENYIFNQLRLIKSGEREIPVMAGLLDDKSEQDLRDLAAYFDQSQMPIGQADPELVNKGKQLYRGGDLASNLPACSGCHSPQGKGNEPAAFPRLSGQQPEYIAQQLKAYRGGERDTGSMSQIMIDIASKLSDRQIEALSSYVSGLH
jgi:cytochrome c553